MPYLYITEDNLENRQNYMYSPYSGKVFLEEYALTRRRFLAHVKEQQEDAGDVPPDTSQTYHRLESLCQDLGQHGMAPKTKEQLDLFVKTFEVRKRLYDDYTGERWKPVEGAGYGCIGRYLLFADALCMGFEGSGCLKYLSCLLKLDDTLLSLAGRMDLKGKRHFCKILYKEMESVQKIMDEAGCEVMI